MSKPGKHVYVDKSGARWVDIPAMLREPHVQRTLERVRQMARKRR